MENNVPNLDAMTPDDLMAFWMAHQQGHNSREIFPNGGVATRFSTALLANYASNKAVAMSCRAKGDIQTALAYESICERIYNRLPSFARW